MLNKSLLNEWLNKVIHYHTDYFILFVICFVTLLFLHRHIINHLKTGTKSYISYFYFNKILRTCIH